MVPRLGGDCKRVRHRGPDGIHGRRRRRPEHKVDDQLAQLAAVSPRATRASVAGRRLLCCTLPAVCCAIDLASLRLATSHAIPHREEGTEDQLVQSYRRQQRGADVQKGGERCACERDGAAATTDEREPRQRGRTAIERPRKRSSDVLHRACELRARVGAGQKERSARESERAEDAPRRARPWTCCTSRRPPRTSSPTGPAPARCATPGAQSARP